ncbi:MAG: hypothetical protein K2X44_07665, partial [Magnetospirillum sp.]|nr:hypothetical protein [Magnetospirillum sp.]
LKPGRDRLAVRLVFALLFLPALPAYALLGSVLNLLPWLGTWPRAAAYYPLMYLLWLCKGVAVLEAALMPSRALKDATP